MGKFWLFVLVFLVSIVGVSAYSCYQESANETNQTGIDGSCGLNYSGSYNYNVTYPPLDGFNIYYAKPKYAVGVNWLAKVQNNTFLNISINSSCWNLNATTLILNVQPHHNFFGANFVRMRCGGTIVYEYNQGAPTGQDAGLGVWDGAMVDGDWNTFGWANDMGVGGRSWGDVGSFVPAYWETNFSFVYEEAVVWDICVPQWEQDIPVCNGYNYTISYSDVNSCGSTADLPVNNGSVISCVGSFCYQESASVPNMTGLDGSCNLSYTGSESSSPSSHNALMNFTKPPYALNSSMFAWKMGSQGGRFFEDVYTPCWSASPDYYLFGLNSYAQYFFTYGAYTSSILCYNYGGGYSYFTRDSNSSVQMRTTGFNNSGGVWALDGNWSTFASNLFQVGVYYWYDNNASVQANPLSVYPFEQTASFIYEGAMLWNICKPNWVSNNTVCNGVNYTIGYYDSNRCGSALDLPVNNGSVVSCLLCNPTWTAYYSPETCTLGYRTKLYYDSSYCNRTINLPFDNGTVSNCNIFSGIVPNQTVKLFDNFKMLISAPNGAVVNMSMLFPNSSVSSSSASWSGQYFESPSFYGFFAGDYRANATAGTQSIATTVTITDYASAIPTQFDSVVSAGQNYSFLLQIFTDSNYTLNHSISCNVPSGFECFVAPSLMVTHTANTTITITSNSSLGDGQYMGSLNVTRVLDGRVFSSELPLGIATLYGLPMVDDPFSYIDLMYSNEIRNRTYIVRNVGNYDLSECNVVVDGTFSNRSFVNGAVNFTLAPNQSAIVPVSYVQPSAGVYTGYFNVFCKATASGFVNGLTNPQYQQLFVLTYSAPFTPAGGGGGAPPVVYISNVSAEKFFLLLNKDGSSNGYISYSYSGDTFSKTFVVQSRVADTLNLRVACKGDFCTNVKLSKSDISLAGFGNDYFTASVVVPENVALDGVYSYEVILTDSKGQSISLINEVHISSLSAWYSKFAFIVGKGDKGYWFSLGGFNFPRLLLYLLLVVGADAVALLVMPKGKFYQKNVLLILTFVSLIVFGLSALIF